MSLPMLRQPAGLSSDTLDPPTSQRHALPDDQWSAHDTVESDDERDVMEESVDHQPDLTIQAGKLSPTTDKTREVSSPSPTAPSPTAAQDATSHEADRGSVHSLPGVQVSEHSNMNGPMTSRSASAAYPASPASSLAPTVTSSLDRRGRHRATLDTRASNRISGFFSSLIHRRDHLPPTPHEQASSSTTPAKDSPREMSPMPSRPSTPPPSLPAPSLTDLGLSLSSITSHLSPSHFSSPPSSGAFLQPHYLLLCHAQGLDVLPLTSPPAPQPYSLIRRVPFKSVVVMEHRGVLVAIAGRRDGVRVYALEEVKRAVEWRIDMEVKREREKNRREELKKALVANHEPRERSRGDMRSRGSPPYPSSSKSKPERRATVSVGSSSTPTFSRNASVKMPPPEVPIGPPPAYSGPNRPRTNSAVPINPTMNRARTTSVNDVLAGAMNRNQSPEGRQIHDDAKADWSSSDDEAIDPVTAPSGSQALDERTSAVPTASAVSSNLSSNSPSQLEVPTMQHATFPASNRRRPANLDLTLTRANPPSSIIATATPPSPTPTLQTIRHALMNSPANGAAGASRRTTSPNSSTQPPALDAEVDEDEDDGDREPVPSSPTTPTRERIGLVEALMESRIPELPPPGSIQNQDAILLGTVHSVDEEALGSPRTSESFSTNTRRSLGDASTRRRRRWSVFDGLFQPSSTPGAMPPMPERSQTLLTNRPDMRDPQTSSLSRSQSTRALSNVSHPGSDSSLLRPATAPGRDGSVHSLPNTSQTQSSAPVIPPTQPPSSSGSRFLPRIITNAFHGRRSEDQPGSPKTLDGEGRRSLATSAAAPVPAPKLEYVKLPGTKGSIMIKAVETAKKSFLAILCGENGEKVELFAGTYRTALGLSRTFILPDSPRSLELQLQGDDLVEVFLVFSQNVFGLEPATVRVREVRIGRAERRAARRRARENQQVTEVADGTADIEAGTGDDDTAVSVTIGVAVTPASPTTATGDESTQVTPLPSPVPGSLHPADPHAPQTESATATISSVNTDELMALATAHTSPYTTFQQLTFAPNFPLATIADEYIIPPTYPSFLEYRKVFEPGSEGRNVDLTQVQFTPPGLPAPVVGPPSQWFYRDPKGVVHGPWTAAVMQQWYKEGLLPLDLPVRREEDTEFAPLKELRLQCVDPMYPFRSSPPPSVPAPALLMPPVDPSKPLLPPMSLLSQPKHFGPPALFFSSRGGHSTTIVDARGRSVLKGRFLWSVDNDDETYSQIGAARLGDVKRLEAFDVKDRAVLVAMRQGGLEAVEFGDALLTPADHSRTLLPHFHPPTGSVNRRGPFVWRIGTPTSSSSGSPPLPSVLPKTPLRFHGKKQSAALSKPPGRNDFSSAEQDGDQHRDEVLFLGRKDDDVYLCERRSGMFRILRISPA